jgi:hypothetical protein
MIRKKIWVVEKDGKEVKRALAVISYQNLDHEQGTGSFQSDCKGHPYSHLRKTAWIFML